MSPSWRVDIPSALDQMSVSHNSQPNATNAANLNIYSPSHQADMGKHENKHWRNEKCTDCNHNCYSDSSHIQATFENPHRVISEVKTGQWHQKKNVIVFTEMNDYIYNTPKDKRKLL